MKKNNGYLVVAALLCILAALVSISSALILRGCGKKEAAVSDTMAAEEAAKEASENDTAIKEAAEPETEQGKGSAKKLDVTNLPADLGKMVPLMDSLNLSHAGYEKYYDEAAAENVWDSILIATVNSDWEEYGFEVSDDGMGLCVPAETAEAMGFAMYGKLTELPGIPESYTDTAEDMGAAPIRIDENGDYIMALGDRGLSAPLVKSCLDNGDGTYLMEVSLNGEGDSFNEIVSFLYTLRENTHSADHAPFAYEIIGCEPADQLTADSIAGVPYLIPNISYGYDLYEENDSKYYEILEVPYFNSFNYEDMTFASLNDRIQEELWGPVRMTEDSDVEWPDVRSYFFTDDDYLQVVSTIVIYPNYATKGDVYSYNYDKTNQRAMTNEDGLKAAGITEEELLDRVASAYKPEGEGEVYDRAELGGFRIKRDGTVDFYLKVFINNDLADDHSEIAVYQMSDGSLTFYDGEELIDASQTDILNPPMTHGKQDSAAAK